MLETQNSIFLLDKPKGQYWSEIKENLNKAPSQREYNSLLDFENRDLLIREKKKECYYIVHHMLTQQPKLIENSPFETPESAIIYFFEETRTEIEEEDTKRLGLSSSDTDREELQIYIKVVKDLRRNGANSFYLKKILSQDTK